MDWLQRELVVSSERRGFTLITDEVLRQIPEISHYKVGFLHLFLKHTSCSLTINENSDPDVMMDMEDYFNRYVPEDASYYRHKVEGEDDMPAHIKSTIIGPSLLIPISNGRLSLGVWQGIFLCEHRSIPNKRRIVLTINGQKLN